VVNEMCTVSAGPRPNPPRNLTVWQTNDGLHIAWQAPAYSPVAVHQYVIEYKTVGQWVPLGEPHSADITKYTWKTVSRGAVYNFRLRSSSSTGARSEPTSVVTFTTTGNFQVVYHTVHGRARTFFSTGGQGQKSSCIM